MLLEGAIGLYDFKKNTGACMASKESTQSYYHAHESAYQQIKDKGYFGWGNAKSLEDLSDRNTKNYLSKTIEKLFSTCVGKKALDLGCGTGATAFEFARMGFDTFAVDISETAIHMAKELAAKQNLKVNFSVTDVLNLKSLNQEFDFIYDSHLLHCIVFDEDRRQLYQGVKDTLATNGLFILDTMVDAGRSFDLTQGIDSLKFDQDYILWHKTRPSKDYGVIEIDGQHWCAQRRVYPIEKVLSEVESTGFIIIEKQIDHQENKPSMLRMVLRRI